MMQGNIIIICLFFAVSDFGVSIEGMTCSIKQNNKS